MKKRYWVVFGVGTVMLIAALVLTVLHVSLMVSVFNDMAKIHQGGGIQLSIGIGIAFGLIFSMLAAAPSLIGVITSTVTFKRGTPKVRRVSLAFLIADAVMLVCAIATVVTCFVIK